MPTHQINITKVPGGTPAFKYEPSTLAVSVGDEIHWTNYDDQHHWPGSKDNPLFFMAGPIGPGTATEGTPSPTFVPGPSSDGSAQVLSYVDSLHSGAPGGTINVNPTHAISIKPIKNKDGTSSYVYQPNPLTGVSVGDLIVWQNYDTVPHWPGPAENPTEFMENELGPPGPPPPTPPPPNTSTAFIPGSSGSVSYVDSLDKRHDRPTGTIVVK